MRRLTAPDGRKVRGAAVRLRRGLLTTAAAAMVVAAGAWPASVGGASASTIAPQSSKISPHDTGYGAQTCVPAGAGVTCTNTFSGNNAYDAAASNQMMAGAPTVTVSQVSNLSHQVLNVSWTNFTPSYNTLGSPTADFINPQFFNNGVVLMECKGSVANGKAVPPLYDGAYGQATPGEPENACYNVFQTGATSGPANMVWAYTSAGTATPGTASCSTAAVGDTVCGTGSAQFEVETKVQNSFLGCNDSSPCYLVVVPDWGGDDGTIPYPDPTPQPSDTQGKMDFTNDCTDHLFDAYGSGLAFGNMEDWNNSCNWADRFVIPLSFAPTPAQFCPSSDHQFTAEGAPELEQAMQQWQPGWCTQKQGKVDFNYNSGVNEYEARSSFLNGGAALTASNDVALVTDPASSQATAGSKRQFTYAPISNTGITISYYLDNSTTGQMITDLKLNARLLAKLLTNSYGYSFNSVCTNSTDPNCGQECHQGQTTQTQLCDPAVAGNPSDIFHDKEFYALNKNYSPSDFIYNDLTGVGDDTEPLVVSGSADMTYELTRWIESDPEAAAFLAGQPDPYGMHVNNYYKTQQTYPISTWQELDPGFTQSGQQANDGPPPHFVATMQATWNFITGQDNVDQSLLNWTSSGLSYSAVCATANGVCGPGSGNVYNQQRNLQELLGARSLFAVTDMGDSGAFQFPTAQLVNSAGNPEPANVDTLTAALNSMKTNPDKITQYQDFTATASNAYPLTEVQYAMVPTCNEPPGKARAIAQFLNNVTTSQLYGTATGQLPPYGGYMTLNSKQLAQTTAAAQAVAAQTCVSAPSDGSVGGHQVGNNSVPPSSNNNGGGGTPLTSGSPLPSTVPSTPAGGVPSASSSPSAKSSAPVEPVALGTKGSDDGNVADVALIVGLVVGGLLAIGGPLAYAVGSAGAGGSLFGRRRPGGTGSSSGGTSAGGSQPTEGSGADD